MVFESLVVDLLNRFLGPYVENLDASQLKLGIWSGDAVLQELFVKEGALDQLNLPVRIKFGHLGKLTLKIPWKNLYSAPVEATLEGLHILVVPNADIKYDAESDAKSKWEAKQKTLQGIEDAKKKEAEKDKPADPKAAGFAEKVATQVIKNIQIKVNDIHVRYEDRTTNKEAPFAIGATLEGFSVLTTDENWLPCILDQSVEMIYKLVQLNSLAVYWNTDSTLYSAMERPQLMTGMKESIAKKEKVPPGYQYLIEPISSQAQMRINPRPEAKMEIPKAWLNLVVNSIGVALQRKQYRDVMKLLQNFEMMARNDPFRKYKPDCPLKGNAKKWWHYAMNSVMKEEIKRRSEMWSWKHMQKHRKMCKEYTKLYLDKLDTSKPGKDLIRKIETLEKEIDVLNITLCRQQAEAEFRRLGKKRQAEGGGGWFGGWFGGKKKEEKKEEEKDIKERFQDAMTEEEKAKMYAAIGYSENVPDPTFPPDYVGVTASVKLEETSVRLIEDADTRGDLVKVAITDLSANFNQRPSAEAIKLEAQLGDFSVFGTPLNGTVPQMVESQTQLADTKLPQIDFNLEVNPMDGLADQRIRLKTQPIKVTYDANTVIEITKFFLPPDDVQLDDLSAAATSGLMDMGGQSTTGLQFMVDNKKITDIGIEIKPLYVVVPEKGVDDGKGRTLILDLGEIGMKTQNDSRHIGERKENESFEELVKKAYDRFDISLKSMQVILTGDGEDWQAARKKDKSPNHILQPLGLNLLLQKCMVEDPRLPKIKMTGDLPDITLDISDFKLEELMKLILSIPFPEGKKPAEDAPKEVKYTSRPSRLAATNLPPVSSSPSDSPAKAKDRKVSDVYVMAKEILPEEDTFESDLEYYSAEDDDTGSSVDPSKKKKKSVAKEMTVAHTRSDVQINFELKEIGVNLHQRKDDQDEPLLSVAISSFGVALNVRPMDMNLEASLGSISVEHKQFQTVDKKPLFLVKTPAFDAQQGRLLTFALKKADKKHPEFSTTFKSTLQNMDVKFTGLEVVAHSEAILHLTEFADNLVASLQVDKKEKPKVDEETVDEGYASEDDKPVVPRRKRKPTEVVDVQLDALLDKITLVVCSSTQSIAEVEVTGLEAGVTVQKDKTAVSACLQAISVVDPTKDAVHPKILSTIDPEVFKMKLTLYNQATEGASYSDMDVVDIRVGLTLGCIRVVFLNKFVAAILSFVEPFSRAKAKAAEAGASAAQSAKTAAADLHTKASRVALDVTLKAPLIVVPRNSSADRGLVANLGELTVKNHFTIATGTEGKQIPAILDNMDVSLSSIQLSRAIIENEQTTSDVLLLEPLHLHAGLVRNMAPWFHGVPAIAVTGKLETIKVAISMDDFGIIMAIVNENIAEGDIKKTATVEEPAAEEAASTEGEKSPSKEKKDEKKGEESKEETSEVWVQVQADFEVGEIGVDLYTGKVHLENKSGRQARPQEKKLGSFQVITIAGSATINSDSSIAAKARLANVLLNDHRADRGDGITKMVYCRQPEDGSPCDMVSVKFEQKSNQDKVIEANLQNLHACICTEFLMSAANIFTKGMAESAKTAPEKPIKAPAQPRAVTSQASASQPAAQPPAEAAPPPAEATPAPQGSISIKAAIERPEIILVADSSTKDTNALVMQFDANVNLTQSENSLAIQGGLDALRINACPFLEEKRKGSINKVLVPCNIGFNLSNPDKKGMKISATIPEIVLNISPPTVMVLSAAAQNLTPPPDEDDEEQEALPPDLWSIKDIANCNFWFLREDEEGTDVAELFAEEVPATKEPQLEELVASIDSIQVKIEAEGGKRFVPMLILQASMHAVVKDWSTKLTVQSSLKMEVSCYNERVAAWEPLVEPVEYEPGNHHPFELQVSVVKNDDIVDTSSLDKSDSEEDQDAIHLAPPAMTVTVSAPENLELTVTKTSLLLFQKLGEAFGEAVKNPGEGLKDNAEIPACTVINQTGLKLDFKPGEYYQMPANSKGGRIHLAPSESSALEILPTLKASIKGTNQATQTSASQDMKISFQLEGYEDITDVNLVQAGCVLYNLKPTKKSGDVVFSVVIDIQAQLDARKVIIRSPLRIINHFHCPLQIFTKASNWVEKIGELPADSEFVVPLEVAHTSELLVGPNDDGYHMCDKSIQWRTLISEKKEGKKSFTFSCPKKEEGHTPFFFNTLCETQSLRYVKGSSLEAPKYDIHINPVVTLKNLLSVPVYYTLQGTENEIEIKSTESTQMTNVDIGKTMMFMRIPDYNGMEWKGEMTLRTTLKEYSQWGFRGDGGKWMEVGVWVNYKQGFQDMAIFTPYWLINKTGLPLAYKGTNDEVLEHPADKHEPIMFAYPTSKSIAPTKNKIQVKCGESQWSDKFSLDAVGSTGFISCKTKEKEFETSKKLDAKGEGTAIPKKYSLGVQIQLSYLNYTKMVLFTPRYLVVNETDTEITVSEPHGQSYNVEVHGCKPFWPIDKKDLSEMVVKKAGSEDTSLSFTYAKPHTTVLKLGEGNGIIVEVQITEAATVVAFRNFSGGNFTLQIINDTEDMPVTFHQQGVKEELKLETKKAQLYTWQQPMGNRSLVWKADDKEHTNKLIKDGIGEIKFKDAPVYWVSFLDGTQRLLLFTRDLVKATKAQQAAELEQVDQEVIVSLPGIGLSLVNNFTRKEISYIGITSSGIIWQNRIRRRWKDLNIKEMKALEDGYQKHLLEVPNNKDAPPKNVKLEHHLEVDFANMLMVKPNKRSMQRTYQHGLWLQLRKSAHQFQFHIKLNRLQVDNQMPAAIFPTVLAPVPLPKTVAADSAPKPMIEFSVMMRTSEHSTVKQFKYLKVLVQEMAVKLDMGFLSSIAALFAPSTDAEVDETVEKRQELMKSDFGMVTSALGEAEYVQVALAKDFNFYDSFHLSPLKIHVSFSLSDTGVGESDVSILNAGGARANTLNLIMQSVGVTLTNVDDVLFKLGFFEREYQFYTPEQLQSEVVKHYSNQALKQLYVLVLGLDVIGNPFGFVRGVGEGVKDFFYEPYQGIVQGPEEFAEGVALGMRSLFGHAVGGAAGAVSRITGTLGKGLAALTMDDEYKRKRQQAINQKPATFQEGMARGGKGLVMGFYEGVSGVVKDPLKGAKKEGAKGFFKGVGKGLAGVVAKPTGGIIDFASGTFEGIRRVVDVSEEVKKIRAPRYLGPDGVTKPYVRHDAEGLALLQMTEKGKFAAMEDYVAHMCVTSDKKSYLLVTTSRIIYTHRGDVMGSWVVEFEFHFKNLKEDPTVSDKGITITPKEKEGEKKSKKGLGLGLLKHKHSSGKLVQYLDKKDAQEIVAKASQARATYLKDAS